MIHELNCSPATVHWGYLDAEMRDVLEIQSGERVKIHTVSGSHVKLPTDTERFQILQHHAQILETCVPELGPHILTGPVGVSGARSGDLLAVTVEEISLCQNWGWNEIHSGDGVLPALEKNDEVIAIPIDLTTLEVVLPWGGSVPAQPFFGVMAVKPPRSTGPVTSLIPGVFGGNMDIRLFGANTTIYFPVHCLGAGFSVGDGHALQGDGEVNGTAVETAMSGIFRLEVLQQAATVPFPFAMTTDRLIAIAVHEDIDIAAVEALRQAVQLLEERFELTAREAYRHVSLCGSLIVSQLVNIKKGIHCSVDVSTLRHREIKT